VTRFFPGPQSGRLPAGEGIPLREIAQSIGDHLGIPTASIQADQLQAHFGFLAMVITLDNPVTSLATRRILGWEATHPGLLADFDNGEYLTTPSPRNEQEVPVIAAGSGARLAWVRVSASPVRSAWPVGRTSAGPQDHLREANPAAGS
jgi:hypothetical protein